MGVILLAGIAISLLVLLFTLIFLRKKEGKGDVLEQTIRQRPVPIRTQPDQMIIGSRAQIARNQRNRARQALLATQQTTAASNNNNADSVAVATTSVTEDSDADEHSSINLSGGGSKIGAKKRAKLEAKAEKKIQREQEQQWRDEKKKKDAMAEEEQKKIDEKEKEDELKREEAERLAREIKEKQEYEVYLKMKAAFSIDEEGYDDNDINDNNRNFLQEFVDHIKRNKVIVLEELSKEFKLKTQAVIERIHELKANGTITGVIDDRGKFIYIGADELTSVAKFIRQRGRISIAELVESSNELINLTPVTSET